MQQVVTDMEAASETLDRSTPEADASGQTSNVISPVVIPKDSRSFRWIVVVLAAGFVGIVGASIGIRGLFGPHFWLILLAYVVYKLWQNSYVMIPDGCQALVTKFGKIEATVGAGRTWLLDPRKKVGYIVNTTKEFPYNAPIREAPTAERVNASIDLFLQFRIEDPVTFIFNLGGVNGFAEKLENAVSEVTRALIYEQRAAAIYDLVGESTEPMLEALNSQFLPAVRFVNANITHAEPSSQEYRMDMAAGEIVRVAKEAYTYQYELQLRKQQDEGDLIKELGGLQEQLAGIKAEIASFQAQIDTAGEKERNRADAYARQLMVRAESEAAANTALLEAQALDIRAISSATYPEILEYRYRQNVLDRLGEVAGKLPQIVSIGPEAADIDYQKVARQMLGVDEEVLFSPEDLAQIRERVEAIQARVGERSEEIQQVLEPPPTAPVAEEGGAA
jgi:regulator of protease activity HflC (stomatin/prohibitin superfamily)